MTYKLNPITGKLDFYLKSHLKLSDIGTRTHAQIEGHIQGIGNYTFPAADGLSSQVLETDGAGVLSWVDRFGCTDLAGCSLINLGTRSHLDLTGIGTNTHTQIDTRLTELVPYTGAVSDVDLGTHDLVTTGVLSSRGTKVLGNYTIAWRDPADTVTNAYLHYDGNLQMRNVSGNITLQADLIDLGTTPLTTSGIITESRTHNDITNLIVENTENGTAAKAAFRAQSDGGSVSLSALSAGHLTSSQYKTDSALLEADASLAGGLHLSAAGASEVGFWTNGTRRGSIWLDGKWKIGVGIPTEVLDVAGNIAVSGTVDGVDIAALSTTVGSLTDNSIADALHRHSELVASDGTPDPALSVNADGQVVIYDGNRIIRNVDNSSLSIVGGSSSENGAYFQVSGKDRTSHLGSLKFWANTATAHVGSNDHRITFGHYNGASTWTVRLSISKDGIVSIGTVTPAVSALLDLTSTTGALLLTRMTTAQKNALTAVNGMLLYDSTLNKFQGYENGSWTSLI